MRNIRSDAALSALLVCALGSRAFAEDQFKTAVSPHASVTSNIAKTQLEVGVEKKWDNKDAVIPTEIPDAPPTSTPAYDEYTLRFFARVPVDGEDSTTARLDRTTSSARLGLRGSRAWKNLPTPGETDVWCGTRVSLAFEYGAGRFEYFPGGVATDREAPIEHSFAVEADYRREFWGKGPKAAPQVRVRYARDWKASDKVGVVRPGTPPAPDTVEDLIIAAPSVAPQLSVRVAAPFSTGSELGFGPSVKYTLDGDPGDYRPGGKAQRVRAELFIYWFPSDLVKGGRIGVSPVLDYRIAGTDKLRELEYGGLIDLRIGTTLFEY